MKAWEICKKENVGKFYVDDIQGSKWEVRQEGNQDVYDLYDGYGCIISYHSLPISQLAEMNFEETIDWSKVPVDTKILVSDNGETWFKRYFDKYKNGKIYAWADGRTSFSARNNDVTGWKYAKLYKGNEQDALKKEEK